MLWVVLPLLRQQEVDILLCLVELPLRVGLVPAPLGGDQVLAGNLGCHSPFRDLVGPCSAVVHRMLHFAGRTNGVSRGLWNRRY